MIVTTIEMSGLLRDGVLVYGLLVWVVWLSFWVWKLRNYKVKTNDSRDVLGRLGSLSDVTSKIQTQISRVEEKLDRLEGEVLLSYRRVGIVRFNPFSDTGGNQSFAVALLTGEKDGIVVVSLHGRDGSRTYVKSIKGGEGVDFPLSKEEQQAVKVAK